MRSMGYEEEKHMVDAAPEREMWAALFYRDPVGSPDDTARLAFDEEAARYLGEDPATRERGDLRGL